MSFVSNPYKRSYLSYVLTHFTTSSSFSHCPQCLLRWYSTSWWHRSCSYWYLDTRGREGTGSRIAISSHIPDGGPQTKSLRLVNRYRQTWSLIMSAIDRTRVRAGWSGSQIALRSRSMSCSDRWSRRNWCHYRCRGPRNCASRGGGNHRARLNAAAAATRGSGDGLPLVLAESDRIFHNRLIDLLVEPNTL